MPFRSTDELTLGGVDIVNKETITKAKEAKEVSLATDDNKESDVVLAPVEKTKEYNSKIKVKESHKCYIGGTFYIFEPGQVYTVNQNVKRILSNADLLAPM